MPLHGLLELARVAVKWDFRLADDFPGEQDTAFSLAAVRVLCVFEGGFDVAVERAGVAGVGGE